LPFAKSRSRPDRSQRKAKLHKRIVSTNYAVPTGSLDKKNRDIVMRLLHELNEEGKTVIIVTHDQGIIEDEPYVVKI
jgi:putative ABC transport system ATP-binding protein